MWEGKKNEYGQINLKVGIVELSKLLDARLNSKDKKPQEIIDEFSEQL